MAKEDAIISVVEHVAGHDVLPLINVLKDKKNVSEFTIAEELKEEINTIRNKLYRLYDFNLVEFTRKKDKKKGWYIYYWTFVPSRIPYLIKDLKRKRLEKLKERIKLEQGSNFFECVNKCMRLTFDKAIDFEFKCPECGQLMNQEDNAKKIENMKAEIAQLESELAKEPAIIHETPKIEIEQIKKPIVIQKKTPVKVIISKKPLKTKKKK